MNSYITNILIVEDSATQAEQLKWILTTEGYSVLIAKNGAEGLSKAKEFKPDIVMSDIMMPEMNGFELCRQIKKDPDLCSTPVVLLTALSDPADVVNGLECGADNFIVKPYNEHLLLARLKHLLLTRELQKDNRTQLGVEIFFTGKKYFITSEKKQILDLLISTYESAVQKNIELNKSQEELSKVNDELEQKVLERTAALTDEIEVRKKIEDDLRASEIRYRSLFSSLQEGFCLLEIIFDDAKEPVDYRFLEVNTAFERMSGFSRIMIIGRAITEVFPKLDEYWLTHLATVAKTGIPATLENHFGDFRRFWEVSAYIPARGQIAAIISDATEKRKNREEREKSQRLESLGVLAGGIAHDFNNLLTVLMGNISLARIQVGEGHKAAERLAASENALRKATDLTRQLLTFARGGEPIKKVIELGGLLKEAGGFALHGSSVKCQFVLDDDLWLVEADEGQLGQVIHNLVINAVQAMPEGGTVTLTAENVSTTQEGKRFVSISVADTGAGIPEHHLQRIFDPYFTTKQQGSGLGLASCYSIIMRHGGDITVTSTLGKESTFYVSLPASEQQSAAKPDSKPEVVHGSGRVLVIDDEELVSEAVQEMLEALGYMVECVENGKAAIDLYRHRKEEGTPFNAVIMDLTIPGGMGGREAIVSLLKLDPDVKAVVSSGYSTDPVIANYRKYGFSAVLSKPYNLQEMSTVLQKLLED